jgi:threonine dehydratase
MNNLSLTEYTANPSPPSASPKAKLKGVIPEEFILPNGYPDVRALYIFSGNLN